MAKNIIKFFIIILLVLLSATIIYQKINEFSLKKDINIDIQNIDKFKLVDIYKNEDDTITNIEAKKGNAIIKIKYIKEIDKESSEEYKDYQLEMLNSVYEPIKSPYPGRITREIVCPEELKPVEVNNNDTNSQYYIMYSTSRYSYGACSWDSIKYRVIFLFRYCENKKELYQVEFFVPLKEFNKSYEKMAESIRCK